jgi:hypothetical protein
MRDITPVARYLVWAMEGCGIMETQTIYRAFKEVCDKHKHPLPDNLQAEVRQTLQAHCSSSRQYRGRDDLFVYHEPGRWSCKATSPSHDDL